MNKKIFIYLIGSFLFLSCSKVKLSLGIKSCIGKTIEYPSDIVCFRGTNPKYNRDSLSATLLFWVDNKECSTCLLNRIATNTDFFDALHDSVKDVSIKWLFTPAEEVKQTIIDVIQYSQLEIPIYVDTTNMFRKKNSFIPKDNRLHTFLLNDCNEIIQVGDPLKSHEMWQLYTNTAKELTNTVITDQ